MQGWIDSISSWNTLRSRAISAALHRCQMSGLEDVSALGDPTADRGPLGVGRSKEGIPMLANEPCPISKLYTDLVGPMNWCCFWRSSSSRCYRLARCERPSLAVVEEVAVIDWGDNVLSWLFCWLLRPLTVPARSATCREICLSSLCRFRRSVLLLLVVSQSVWTRKVD